jgi:formate hydrogenlyase subunit 3/multisubunit Na+/H+ antiporter MnhD subunit
MIDWLALSVATPLLGAVLATVVPARSPTVGGIAALLTTAVSLVAAVLALQSGPLRSELGGWGAPLGIALQADGLSAVLLVMANLVSLGISVYARDYFAADGRRHFWPLWLLLWTSLNGLFLAADLFNIYVALELLGISAAALGALSRRREAVAANLRYLLVGLLGSMTYLLGVALAYTGLGTLDLGLAARALTPGPLAWTTFALLIGGLLLKTALFPLHFWLPPAHAQAPAPVSAALSALVVKAAFYLVLRLWIDLFGPITGPAAGTLLGALGAGGVIWGSWRALRAERLKLLAAYSTVAQVGYLFLFFPLMAAAAMPRQQQLFGALVLLALTHGFAKAGLFLSAGVLQKFAGHDRIADLGPAMRSLPAVAFTIGLAGVALIGLPPSGTFVAKWILLSESLVSGQWWWAPVVLIGTLLAAAYVFRLLGNAFGPIPSQVTAGSEEVPQSVPVRPGRIAQAPGLLMTIVAIVLLGLGAEPLWMLLRDTLS